MRPRRLEDWVRACSCEPDDEAEGLSALGCCRRWSTLAMVFWHLLGSVMSLALRSPCGPRGRRDVWRLSGKKFLHPVMRDEATPFDRHDGTALDGMGVDNFLP